MSRKSKTKSSNNRNAKAAQFIRHQQNLLIPSATLVATAAMKAAREACEAKVDAIVEECIENNCKFRDQKFDLLNNKEGCLYKSEGSTTTYDSIAGVKRVADLFRKPVFFLNGATPDDIKQGSVGDCWFLASLAAVSNISGLLEQVCVKRNEEIGVYGFIFFKDGDWVSTVVDDQLFYKTDKSFRSALYFSACRDDRETWLPLMEKAYAKIHGDYESISGGFTAEGVEDLTGGIASMVFCIDILSKDRFWEQEMKQVNKTLLLGCAIDFVDGTIEKHGVMSGHAYSVLNAVEYKGERLVLVRNPWGEVEWNGDWSDDSDKWTPEAMKQLNHKESDDGQFWMSYKDFLRVFTTIDRCRIFDSTWSVASSWITYNVKPRSSGKFELEIKKGGETVIVLTQPDSRYYGAHLSEYNFNLSFHVYDTNKKLVKRSKPSHPYSNRSANCEVKLKPGKYTVIPIVISKSKEVKEDDSVSTKARLQGRVLLGVDEEDFEEIIEVEEKGEKWQVTIGLRVYTHNPDTTLEGVAGEHPSKKKEETKEVDDPESVTATLAGKKTENKDGEETAKEKKEEEEEKKTEEKTEEKKEEKEEEEKEEKEEEEEAKKVVGKDKETEKEEGKEEETKKEEGKEEDTKKVEGKEETKEEENAEKNEGEKLAEAEKEE